MKSHEVNFFWRVLKSRNHCVRRANAAARRWISFPGSPRHCPLGSWFCLTTKLAWRLPPAGGKRRQWWLDHSCKCNQSPQNITILYNWYHTHSDLLHLLFICEMRYGMKLHDAVAGHGRPLPQPGRQGGGDGRAYSRAKPIHHKVWCVTTQWGEPLSLGLMSREKVKNHEYSFDIGSNPTETVIEMCVCVLNV